MTEITPIRSTAEVQADIDALIANIEGIDDQIFAGEQLSTDYRALLENPSSGTENLATLSVLRERRRALEIALEAARKDLEGAELQEFREETRRRREELKQLLKLRDKKAGAAMELLEAAVHLVVEMRGVEVKIINSAALTQSAHLTDQGYLVLRGIQVLNDMDLIADWAKRALEKGLRSGGRQYFDFVGQVEEISRNVLRQWDLENSTHKLKLIDHDPADEATVAAAPTPETVEPFDQDPTEDDLAGIASLPPDKAAKAMNAFANSRWGRAQGLKPQGTTPAQG